MKSSMVHKKTINPVRKGMVFVKSLTMKKRILVADDDPSIRDIFGIILDKAGYEVDLKADATELLQNNFIVPDIFLIDKLLSGIDGLDVCRHLKNNPLTNSVPIIMVSASPDIGVLAAKAGADDFIEKPFEMSYLINVVERYTNPAKSKRAARKIL